MATEKRDSFTDAERAAFEWSRNRNRSGRDQRRSRSRSRRRSYSRIRSDSSSDSDHPKDPFNPLKLAYDRRGRHRRSRSPYGRARRRSTSQPTNSPDTWIHDLYYNDEGRAVEDARYQRGRREQDSTSYKLDTRRGSWRSKAGGVYIPPDEAASVNDDLYSDYKPTSSRNTARRSPSYERPDPVYTLD
ncbi:hypothetical protein, conserved [Babesia bigemina]|uniref:Btz domain-containing protein n=1 Tax=Babesia bigemina TaxID=5866 RepID=A0A061D931_BABBI|nr:hypothetical protein, conserved [Babesia bigemina]CDR95404.1 hypothetical protein, conserved [Babesia bigemina]|eukprot:XP_012767590.1 hypothetical protein, conserved [Babesia bigemina]